MPDTGERREITSRVNAREAETLQASKKLLSKEKQSFATADAKNQERNRPSTEASNEPTHDGPTAQPPALSSRKDVRRAVRKVRRAAGK